MKNVKTDGNSRSFSEKFGNWVVKRKWPVLIGSILLAVGIGFGGQFVGFNSDYHVFFSEENPQLQAFDALQEKYTKDDNVFVVVEPSGGDVFTNEALESLEKLVEQAWQTPHSTRVDAITNFQHTKAVEDDLYVDDLVREGNNKSPPELAEIKDIATKEPLLVNRLIDSSGSITAVNITIQLPGEEITEGTEVVNYVRGIVDEFERINPGYKTFLSGTIMLNNAFLEASNEDMATLIPLMMLIILLTIYFTTRSFAGTFASLMVIILSMIVAVGATGWLGIQLTPPSAAAFTIIMTLAIADSIHVLVTIIQQMKVGKTKEAAIVESIKMNFMPVFITSLTTVIGFLTMNFSDAPPFHDLGNITSVGMTAAFLFSITILPALVAILPMKVKLNTKNGGSLPILDRLADFVIGNHKRVFWGSATAIIFISLLSVQNELDDQFLEYFESGIEFRSDTDYISERLTGIYNVEFSIGAGESGGVNNPEYLANLETFENWLYEQDEVIHINSYVTVAKRVNKSMHGDSVSYYKIPTQRDEAAQYLLLYEMSLPFGLDLNNQINVDKSETRLTATVENMSSTELIAFTERAETWLAKNTPDYMFSQGVSPTLMFSHLTKRQISSMMSGTGWALLLISVILMLALGSFKYGALSLIPNITPITVGFGIWALSEGTINAGIAIVFGMTLGIIVDDTVHFISKYLRAIREKGKTPEEAVRYAFATVGRALLVTTIVLISGFMVLAQSQFGMNSGMAKITVLIISLALIIDFLLLPALLLAINKKPQAIREDSELITNMSLQTVKIKSEKRKL